VINAAEVACMRKAESDSAGGIPLIDEIDPSDKYVAYFLRGFKAEKPFMREYDLARACTLTAATSVRSYVGLGELEKAVAEKEFDTVAVEGNGVIVSLQRILLNTAALGIASADSSPAAETDEDDETGIIANVKGERRRMNGGRQMMFDVLSHIFEHGGGKSGDMLERCYMASVKHGRRDRGHAAWARRCPRELAPRADREGAARAARLGGGDAAGRAARDLRRVQHERRMPEQRAVPARKARLLVRDGLRHGVHGNEPQPD